jgi:hypothetical protein
MTKAWHYNTSQLAERRSVAVDDGALEWFELQDFFHADPSRPARPWKSDRNGSLKLDLDDVQWRLPGRGILK